MKPQKQAELSLPYYKQGDDLSQILGDLDRDNLTPDQLSEALLAHAAMLEGAAQQLSELAATIKLRSEGTSFSVQADTHSIIIAGQAAVISRAIKTNHLVEIEQWDEEEEDD